MDIGEWLGNLGLERYNAAFRENAIDTDVLRDLTDQDLEKLGVLLGDRRRLLRAIAVSDDGSAAASSPAPVKSPVTMPLISAAAASPTSSTVEVSRRTDRYRRGKFWRTAPIRRTAGIGADHRDGCDPAAPDPRSCCHRRHWS